MKMYFLTRKEARAYCKQMGVPYSKIGRPVDGNGSHSWYVDAEEVTTFKIGKVYKIVDEAGFVKTNPYSVVNTANRIQLQQIKTHLPNGIKIINIDDTKQIATFEAPVGVSFNTLRFEEAQYFSEVKPVVSSEPKPVITPVPVKPSVTLVSDDLDAELDGGVSLTNKEKDPNNWLKNQKYILVDRNGFLESHDSNSETVDYINANYNGVYTITNVTIGGNVYIKVDDDEGCADYLYHSERKFFREIESVQPTVTSTEDIRDAKRKELIKALEDAQKEHDEALSVVAKAANKVFAAADALAKFSK